MRNNGTFDLSVGKIVKSKIRICANFVTFVQRRSIVIITNRRRSKPQNCGDVVGELLFPKNIVLVFAVKDIKLYILCRICTTAIYIIIYVNSLEQAAVSVSQLEGGLE